MLCLSVPLSCKDLVPRRKEQVQPKSKDPTFVPSILQKLERSRPHQPTPLHPPAPKESKSDRKKTYKQASARKCFSAKNEGLLLIRASTADASASTSASPWLCSTTTTTEGLFFNCVDDESALSPTLLELLSMMERQLNLGDLLPLQEQLDGLIEEKEKV